MKNVDKVKRAVLTQNPTDEASKLIKLAYEMGKQSNRIASAAKVVTALRRNLDSLWSDEDKKSLDRAIQILNSEAERELDAEAHSEVTIEAEEGRPFVSTIEY